MTAESEISTRAVANNPTAADGSSQLPVCHRDGQAVITYGKAYRKMI